MHKESEESAVIGRQRVSAERRPSYAGESRNRAQAPTGWPAFFNRRERGKRKPEAG